MHSAIILLIGNLFSSDMIIIVFVALLLFGGEKLPEIARGLGKGIRDFEDASEDVKREINNQINAFEDKREEKKMEEAIIINQHAAQNQTLIEGPLIENTMPTSDINFNAGTHGETESHETGYAIPEAENQAEVSHVNTTGANTNEHQIIHRNINHT